MRHADVTIEYPIGSALCIESAPARSAVVLLSDQSHRPILLATTADARSFLSKRLTPSSAPLAAGAVEQSPRQHATPDARARAAPRADLSAVVAHAELWLAGSGLEADLTFLNLARARMPETCNALTEHWRAWFIHLDPDAPAPTWRKTNLADDPGVPLHTFLGPVTTKHAAARLGEGLTDAFDLCRFPRELALAPHGSACAYKEMGRCPAPCDGSEPMDSYRARVASAIATLRLDPALRGHEIESSIRRAADRHDFESAAALKSRLDRLATLGTPSMREARPMDQFHFLAILASGRPGWARAWRIDPWSCIPLADLDGTKARQALGALDLALGHAPAPSRDNADNPGPECANPSSARARPSPQVRPLDPSLLGIITRHLLAPPARRRGGFLRLHEGSRDAPRFDHAAAARLLRSAARTDTTDVDEFDRAALT